MTTQPEVERVYSRDGTPIGFLRQGQGPGIVLVQGAMADVCAFRDLAAALSRTCTVVSAERRGRGLSPRPYEPDHDMMRDVEDLDAVMSATGARALFGLSSGAVIALEATRVLDRIEHAVMYEPPFYADGIDRAAVARLFDEIEAGDLPSALLDSLLASGTAPALLGRLPRPLARTLARAVIATNARQRGPGATFRDLLPGVRFDFHDVASVDGRIGRYASITTPTLLLRGTKSPLFLQQAIGTLHDLIPHAQLHEFAGLGHDGPWNAGDPKSVAAVISDFLHRRGASQAP